MILFKELISKKLEFYMELQNSQHYSIANWNLFITYLVCCNLIGHIDKEHNKKIELFSKMFSKISKGEYDNAEKVINELNNLAHEELNIINETLTKLEERTELLNELGDINPERYLEEGFVMVSVWDSI